MSMETDPPTTAAQSTGGEKLFTLKRWNAVGMWKKHYISKLDVQFSSALDLGCTV